MPRNEAPPAATEAAGDTSFLPAEFAYEWTCRVGEASEEQVTAVMTPEGATPGGELVADFQQDIFPIPLGWGEAFRITTARPGLPPVQGTREELFYSTVSETTDEAGVQRTVAVQKLPPLSPEEHAAALRRAQELHARIQRLVVK